MSIKKQTVWMAACLCSISAAGWAGPMADLEQSASVPATVAPKPGAGQSVQAAAAQDETCINLSGLYRGKFSIGGERELEITQDGCKSITLKQRITKNPKLGWVWVKTFTAEVPTGTENGTAFFGKNVIVGTELTEGHDGVTQQIEVISKDGSGKIRLESYLVFHGRSVGVHTFFQQD